MLAYAADFFISSSNFERVNKTSSIEFTQCELMLLLEFKLLATLYARILKI